MLESRDLSARPGPRSGPAGALPGPEGRAHGLPFLLALLAFLVFNAHNGLWLAADGRPLVWDHHSHYTRGQKFAYFVRHGHRLNLDDRGPGAAARRLQGEHPAAAYAATAPIRGFASFAQGLYMGPKHPPAVHALAGLFMAVFGPDPDGAVFCVNLVFSAILIFSVFALAARMAGSWAGAAASWAAALLPAFALEAHVLMLDLPLAAAVALSWVALARVDGFRDRRAGLAAGAALGFGWLVKETFPVFVLVPLAAACLPVLGELRRRGLAASWRSGPLANLVAAAGVAFLVCGFWFLPHLPRMPAVLLKHQVMGGAERDPAWWQAAGALFYPCALVNAQASFLFVAALAGLLPLLLRRALRAQVLLLLACLLVPALLFTFLSNKDARYTLPALPAVAVLLGMGLTAFRLRPLNVAAPLLLFGFGMAQGFQHGWQLFGAIPSVPLVGGSGAPKDPALFLFADHPAMRVTARPAAPGPEELRAVIRTELLRQGETAAPFEVRPLFDLPEVTAPVEQAFAWANLDARFTGRGREVRIRSGLFDPAAQIEAADLVLVKPRGRTAFVFQEAQRRSVEVFEAQRDRFVLVGAFAGPDGHRIEAYRPGREP